MEEALASWVEPLVHVTTRLFRLEEQKRRILAPSTTDVDPLGLSEGGLNTKKTLHFTELFHLTFSALLQFYAMSKLIHRPHLVQRYSMTRQNKQW